jgi:hypothetical protein
MTMTTTETPFMDATRRSQRAFLRLWADSTYRFLSLLPVPDGKAPNAGDARAPHVPTVEDVVDDAFDYADAVLDVQRECVKSILAVNRSVANSAASMAQSTDKDAGPKES